MELNILWLFIFLISNNLTANFYNQKLLIEKYIFLQFIILYWSK